jgi:hypothetical protein
MTLLETALDFMKDPDNSWILYGIALFLIADAVLGRFISRYALTFKGNNSGIVVNGDVDGNITQTQIHTADNDALPVASKVIGLVANVCGTLGLLLAAATFYLTYVK